MINIFAKIHTTEKVIIFCHNNEIPEVQLKLNNKLGGNWIFVDTIYPSKGEFIKFDDGYEYKGFDGIRDRYSDAINSIVPPTPIRFGN